MRRIEQGNPINGWVLKQDFLFNLFFLIWCQGANAFVRIPIILFKELL